MDYSKQSLWFVRSGFIVVSGLLGAIVRPFTADLLLAAFGAAAVGALTVGCEIWLRRRTLKSLMTASIGMLLGTICGLLLVVNVAATPVSRIGTGLFLKLVVPIVGAYLGFVVGLSKPISSQSANLGSKGDADMLAPADKILDTSVLIDGRISDIVEAGFLDGRLIVPQFVLHELQTIADSADSARRNRGRRGLDVVGHLQKIPGIDIRVLTQDFPAIREVDLKLIQLAKVLSAKIVTNDFNLNKLAQVQGLRVLNINELANSVKPIVLPGEAMRVFILKEGKEHNQGVAYLDDGTMVVVDNARRLISKTVDVTVTSVLQTTAGKMIFGKYDERQQSSEQRTGSSASNISAAASAGTS